MPQRPHRRRSRGATLVEIMVVLAILAILGALGVGPLVSSVARSKEYGLTRRFIEDFSWARSAAYGASASLTLSADCSWSTTVGGVSNADHSMSATSLAAAASGLSCAGDTLALPATFNFSSQGFSSATGRFLFTGSHGEQWALQVLLSGSLIREAGAS